MKWTKPITSLHILADTWPYIGHRCWSCLLSGRPSLPTASCFMLNAAKLVGHVHSSLILPSPTEGLFILALATSRGWSSVHWGGDCVQLGNVQGVTVRGSDGEPGWPGLATVQECPGEPTTYVWKHAFHQNVSSHLCLQRETMFQTSFFKLSFLIFANSV